MKIGEIVETLITIKDAQKPLSREEQALIEACNLLARLPRIEEATTADVDVVVRCGECVNRRRDKWCMICNLICNDKEYCNYGIKKKS